MKSTPRRSAQTPVDSADPLLAEARRMRHFVVLAEESHYGRASERLGIDQPSLSRSIMRLEQALGARLLRRSARSVSLTPAGEVFLAEARNLIAQAQLSTTVVQRAQSGALESLRIGFTPTAMFRALPEVLRQLRDRHPEVRIVMHEAQSYQHVEGLRSGDIDAAFINGDVLKKGEFQSHLMEREKVIAAVPSAWPVAQARTIRLRDLANLPFIIVSKHTSPTMHEGTLLACRAAGFTPRIVPGENVELLSRLGMVASNFGVMLASEYTRLLPVTGVTYLPVTDLPDYLNWDLVIAWHGRVSNPILDELVRICRAVARKAPASAKRRRD